MSYIRPALVLMALFTLLLGIAYPLAITGVAQTTMPRQANGSLIERQGKVIGSELIGQSFSQPGYFWSRPSAAGQGYDASASSGSNLGPTSKPLAERMAGDVKKLNDAGVNDAPADLVSASGSGLDPHISPAAARVQIARVAKARGMSEDKVRAIVAKHTSWPAFGFFGEPTVNVLLLNLTLDETDP